MNFLIDVEIAYKKNKIMNKTDENDKKKIHTHCKTTAGQKRIYFIQIIPQIIIPKREICHVSIRDSTGHNLYQRFKSGISSKGAASPISSCYWGQVGSISRMETHVGLQKIFTKQMDNLFSYKKDIVQI